MAEIPTKPTSFIVPSGTRFVAGGEVYKVVALKKKSYNENENKYEAESNGGKAEFLQKAIMQKLT
jgi:hypothetical protein